MLTDIIANMSGKKIKKAPLGKKYTCPHCGKIRSKKPRRKDLCCSKRCGEAYAGKTCPKCGKLHHQFGDYCSSACGMARDQSEKMKEALSRKGRERINDGSDESEIRKWAINKSKGLLPGMKSPKDAERQWEDSKKFVIDGILWEEDDHYNRGGDDYWDQFYNR